MPSARRFLQTTLVTLCTIAGLGGCGHTDGMTGGDVAAARVAAAAVELPADYRSRYTRYAEVYCLDQRQVRTLWANDAATTAARLGTELPVGAVLVSEMSALDSAGGQFIVGTLKHLSVTRRIADHQTSDTLSDYSFRGADAAGRVLPARPCSNCHYQRVTTNFVFTGDELAKVARRSSGGDAEPLRHPSTFRSDECH